MKETVIYVAGNPDAYPIEYYDTESGTYQGVIPELLQQFAEQTGYDIQYYSPGKSDQRAQLAENRQVDLISGCIGTETFRHKKGGEIVFLETMKDGEPVVYQILVSDVAPSTLGKELQTFLAKTTQETKTGLLIETAGQYSADRQTGMQSAIIVLSVSLALVLVFLISAIIAVVRKYRRRLASLEQVQETDEITGIGNMDYLIHCYHNFLNDKNRILYSMVYFYIDTERVERMESRDGLHMFLRHMAAVLQEYTTDSDILARVADGGFVLLRQTINMQEAEEWLVPVLERIHAFSEQRETVGAYHVSAGIYSLKIDDRDLNEILFNAAQSAQSAYHSGELFKLCTNEVLQAFMEEQKLQGQIERGLKNEEFQLYIQFYVDAATGRIVGGEALSRWDHPEKGLLSPGQFVPLMEKEKIIDQLDYYALNKACAFLEELQLIAMHDFFVSCNFSQETFSSDQFVKQCEEIIQKYQFDRGLLVFEITESAIIKNPDRISQNVKAVKQMGIRIVLDDFGDGFTSVFDIQDYPLYGLKLDKKLIDHVGTDSGDVILRAMIQVGQELGITIFAEGIESDTQASVLREMGCNVIQGFQFYYPLPEWEAVRKLVEQTTSKEEVRS